MSGRFVKMVASGLRGGSYIQGMTVSIPYRVQKVLSIVVLRTAVHPVDILQIVDPRETVPYV